MRFILAGVIILTHCLIFGQIVDDFSDGNFTASPTWSGTDADYIVNTSGELQLNNSIAATSYLSLPHSLSSLNNTEWQFTVRQTFSPSGSNFGRIYLTSNAADITTNPDGFYIQLGEAGSNDAVRLFKVDGGVSTELITGPLGQIASSFNIGLKVVRDATGNWSLYIDAAGGSNYALVGTANDPTNLLGTHSGVTQSYTVSNATKFYYDNVYIGDEIVDVAAPNLLSATALSASFIDVEFDEAIDQTSAETLSNYTLNGFTVTAAVLDANQTTVHLNVSPTLANGQTYTLNTANIADIALNISGNQSTDFSYLIAETAVAGDLVINEFMCDPSPTVGLKEVEFVELYNTSSKIFNLQGWKIGDASSEGTITSGWIMPNEYVILTANANVDSFAVAYGVSSFPSLNNSGDNIVIKTDLGVTIDSISYTDAWYNDAAKASGGYSIERINPNDPCTDISDWTASENPAGGTPGIVNSVFDNTPDIDAPAIAKLVALAPNFVEVYFTEGMDSTSLSNTTVTTSPVLTVQNQFVLATYPDMMTIQFNENLVGSQVYNLELDAVADCWQNTTSLNGTFVLSDVPQVGDVIVNEILFNPITGGTDYVELYNNSEKILDLNNWSIANFDDDTISNHSQIESHYFLYPESYVVLTEDSSQTIADFPFAVPGRFIEMDLPTYSNDSGSVYLVYGPTLVEHASYNEDWHFQLLDDVNGKSLERIDPNGSSVQSSNWHTAAESVGFGTPGMENSQYIPAQTSGQFSYTNETVSPDNDGFEDVLQINYEMDAAGYVGTFSIFDDRGRFVTKVMDSELLGTEGSFTWKGLTDSGAKATIGAYVGVFEVYSTNGGVVYTERKAFVVAGHI